MRILILGGTRFIGPYVVKQLLTEGHTVTLFHRGVTEVELPETVVHIHGDWTRLEDLAGEFKRIAPDVVVYMVPIGEEDSRRVVQALVGIARRIVGVSSADVYRAYGRLIGTEPGPLDPVPLTENSPLREKLYPNRGANPREAEDPLRWVDDYDKILVEGMMMSEPELPSTIQRLPMVYGPRDNQHRLYEYLKRMDDGRPALILSEALAGWRTCRGYVENVAVAIACAAMDSRATGRVYNVAEPESFTELEWVIQIARVTEWDGQVIVLPNDQVPKPLCAEDNLAQDLSLDSTRIRTELGYRELIPHDEAVARTIEWERAHPPETIDAERFDYAAEDAALADARQLTR